MMETSDDRFVELVYTRATLISKEGNSMELRSYQIECVNSIEQQLQTVQRTLAVLATGTGKTIIYLSLVDKWARAGKRVLILAHRRELIHQPFERATQYFPNLASRMGTVMATQDDSDAQVIIATIQTVAKGRLLEEKFDYVILDEAHHGTAKTYLTMVERFGTAKWAGFTATPFRHDGDSLAKVFNSVAYRFPINAAIDEGTLVPFDAYGFTLPISIKGLEESADGWNDNDLGELLSAPNAIEIVYEKWAHYCSDRQTICFTASVRQAHATAEYFKDLGIAAHAIDGATPKKERDLVLRQFSKGKIQVVCNCQVWTEGVDVPSASAALMVCPTKSDLAYVQKLGRILRTAEGKKNAVVLDFAPIEDRDIIGAGDILGIPKAEKDAAKKAEKAGLMVKATHVDDRGLVSTVDPSVVVVEALSYLRKGNLAWSVIDSLSVASLSDKAMLAIELPNSKRISKAEAQKLTKDWSERKERLYNSLKQYRLWVMTKDGYEWTARFAGGWNDMESTMKICDKEIDQHYIPALARRKGAWRRRPVSPAQIKYMNRLKIEIPEGGLSQGQAAQLIGNEQALRLVSKFRPTVEVRIMSGV